MSILEAGLIGLCLVELVLLLWSAVHGRTMRREAQEWKYKASVLATGMQRLKAQKLNEQRDVEVARREVESEAATKFLDLARRESARRPCAKGRAPQAHERDLIRSCLHKSPGASYRSVALAVRQVLADGH